MIQPIAILGAGPAGLALARLLEIKGIPYIVFERDESAESGRRGGTLDIHTATGQAMLKEAGLFEEFKRFARYEDQAFKAIDKDGNLLMSRSGDGEEDRPEIDRNDLRRILLDSIPSERIKWGVKVEAVHRETDDSITIHFTNGSTEKGFKLVVGADGAWSKARNLITSAKPVYSGMCYLETTISPSNPLHTKVKSQIPNGMQFATSLGRAIIAQRNGDDSYKVYTALKVAESWFESEAEAMRTRAFREKLLDTDFVGWDSDITDLVRYSDEGAVYPWQLFSMPVEALSWKTVPGVALMGDAAHVAVPNGEGVNIAMFDALQLANEIERAGLDHLFEAVQKYEEDMFPRAIAHIEDGANMGAMMFADDSPRALKEWMDHAMAEEAKAAKH